MEKHGTESDKAPLPPETRYNQPHSTGQYKQQRCPTRICQTANHAANETPPKILLALLIPTSTILVKLMNLHRPQRGLGCAMGGYVTNNKVAHGNDGGSVLDDMIYDWQF
jgi:hypothetical protein